MLREIRDPVVRDGYLQTLARRTGVEERVLLEALRAPEPVARPGGRARRPRRAPALVRAASPRTPIMSAPGHDRHEGRAQGALHCEEARLLRLLLLVPEQQERVAETLAAQERGFPAPRPASCWRRCSPIASGTARPAAPASSSACGSSTRCRRSCMAWPSPCTRSADPRIRHDLARDHVRIRRGPVPPGARGGRLEDEIRFNAGELMEAQAAGDTAGDRSTARNATQLVRGSQIARSTAAKPRATSTTAGGHR